MHSILRPLLEEERYEHLIFLFVTLIEAIQKEGISGYTPAYFDFGISTESHGNVLNEGLTNRKNVSGDIL